jgi:hypothetical protein
VPKNWEARQAKLEGRKNRMPKHGLSYVRLASAAIAKRGTKRAYKDSERGSQNA